MLEHLLGHPIDVSLVEIELIMASDHMHHLLLIRT